MQPRCRRLPHQFRLPISPNVTPAAKHPCLRTSSIAASQHRSEAYHPSVPADPPSPTHASSTYSSQSSRPDYSYTHASMHAMHASCCYIRDRPLPPYLWLGHSHAFAGQYNNTVSKDRQSSIQPANVPPPQTPDRPHHLTLHQAGGKPQERGGGGRRETRETNLNVTPTSHAHIQRTTRAGKKGRQRAKQRRRNSAEGLLAPVSQNHAPFMCHGTTTERAGRAAAADITASPRRGPTCLVLHTLHTTRTYTHARQQAGIKGQGPGNSPSVSRVRSWATVPSHCIPPHSPAQVIKNTRIKYQIPLTAM